MYKRQDVIRGLGGDNSDSLSQGSPLSWYSVLPVALLFFAVIMIGRSIKKKSGGGIKAAAAAYLAGEVLLMVITIPAYYGVEEMVTDSFASLGLGFLVWIFCSPAILISLYLLFHKPGDEDELTSGAN